MSGNAIANTPPEDIRQPNIASCSSTAITPPNAITNKQNIVLINTIILPPYTDYIIT